MSFDWMNDYSLSDITQGSDEAVLPDVAYGGPSEQPSNPAGNGFGQYIFGAVDKAINYAILRDQQEMRAKVQTAMPTPRQAGVPAQATNAQALSNRQLLVFGLVGIGIFMAVKA
jgi:hypothetical protein